MSKFSAVAINVGSILLASTLIGLGVVELFNPAALGACAAWGYPERFRVLVAAVEICGGLLSLVPRVAWYSSALLGIFLAASISMHLWTGTWQMLLPAGALFAGVAIIGYARHPRTFALARLRAVADAVAEREIAQQRGRSASPGKARKRLKATSARTRPAGRAVVATNFASRGSEV
jgi:hypothetical protein